ncbi:SDR family oxidoreductase, partial [Microcoleus sp. K5-D4]|uniref:SDR family oxidoreductase n=1 Tax=Microcoleus sp. K5-D4 TaxID=2818801 RepID=UPI002FD617CC
LPIFFYHKLAQSLLAMGFGWVVTPPATYGVYVATKGAVEQLTRSLAKELGYRQNTVNVISPGPTDTELFTVGKTVEQIQRFTQITALGRLGKVEDIADVTAFLCSDQARWIIGQNICVNGGTA